MPRYRVLDHAHRLRAPIPTGPSFGHVPQRLRADAARAGGTGVRAEFFAYGEGAEQPVQLHRAIGGGRARAAAPWLERGAQTEPRKSEIDLACTNPGRSDPTPSKTDTESDEPTRMQLHRQIEVLSVVIVDLSYFRSAIEPIHLLVRDGVLPVA